MSDIFLVILGGDAKLLVMLCVSPAQRFITETLQCLGFGSRARQIARGQTKKRRPTSFVPSSISLGLPVVCVWLYYLRSSGPSSLFLWPSHFQASPPKKKEKNERKKGKEREEEKRTPDRTFSRLGTLQ